MVKTKLIVRLINLISLLAEMKQKDLFNELILELVKCNSDPNILFSDDFGGMQSSDNFHHIVLSKKAMTLINAYSDTLYANFRKKDKVDFRAFDSVVRREVTNYVTSSEFKTETIEENRKILQDCIEKKFKDIENTTIIHHFPASTLKFNIESPLNLGVVHIRTIEQWLNSIDFSPDLFSLYNKNTTNADWKKEVTDCLKNNLDIEQIGDIAHAVYSTVKETNSIVSIEVSGYEPQLSRKFAKQICKVALDMVSLTLGDQRVFYNNILQLERVPSLGYGEFTETNGYLNLPSSGLSKVFLPGMDAEQYTHIERLLSEMIEPYKFIINGVLNPESVICPNLVSKWVFALNWYAEGMRESNDAIAVAKLASCLDTLSASGRLAGIKEVLRNVYDCDDDHILFGERELNPITIHTFVKRFYDDGRSRILHGTLKNMLESFEVDRNRLENIARRVLLELANRLYVYKGEDTEKAFRTMKYNQ